MEDLDLAWMCAAEEKLKVKKHPNLNDFFFFFSVRSQGCFSGSLTHYSKQSCYGKQ